VERRIFQHRTGRVKATKRKGPWKLYTRVYVTVSQARQVEYRLKRMKNRQVIERYIAWEIFEKERVMECE